MDLAPSDKDPASLIQHIHSENHAGFLESNHH